MRSGLNVVFPRHYLCPFDSRVQGSSPWVCLVCGQLRAWLRGTGYMSMVITGGKRGNRRGAATSWFKHPLPEPHDMALLTYLHFNRKRLEKLFRGPVAGGVLRVYWDGRVLIRVVGRYGSGTRHIYVKELDGSMPPGSTIEFTK